MKIPHNEFPPKLCFKSFQHLYKANTAAAPRTTPARVPCLSPAMPLDVTVMSGFVAVETGMDSVLVGGAEVVVWFEEQPWKGRISGRQTSGGQKPTCPWVKGRSVDGGHKDAVGGALSVTGSGIGLPAQGIAISFVQTAARAKPSISNTVTSRPARCSLICTVTWKGFSVGIMTSKDDVAL